MINISKEQLEANLDYPILIETVMKNKQKRQINQNRIKLKRID